MAPLITTGRQYQYWERKPWHTTHQRREQRGKATAKMYSMLGHVIFTTD